MYPRVTVARSPRRNTCAGARITLRHFSLHTPGRLLGARSRTWGWTDSRTTDHRDHAAHRGRGMGLPPGPWLDWHRPPRPRLDSQPDHHHRRLGEDPCPASSPFLDRAPTPRRPTANPRPPAGRPPPRPLPPPH